MNYYFFSVPQDTCRFENNDKSIDLQQSGLTMSKNISDSKFKFLKTEKLLHCYSAEKTRLSNWIYV